MLGLTNFVRPNSAVPSVSVGSGDQGSFPTLPMQLSTRKRNKVCRKPPKYKQFFPILFSYCSLKKMEEWVSLQFCCQDLFAKSVPRATLNSMGSWVGSGQRQQNSCNKCEFSFFLAAACVESVLIILGYASSAPYGKHIQQQIHKYSNFTKFL